ncbi:hypothetical protein M5689_011835 [Euphorbia peplus]|nr:hypothetical protein M5689_011835 [Euphorbia peplus]
MLGDSGTFFKLLSMDELETFCSFGLAWFLGLMGYELFLQRRNLYPSTNVEGRRRRIGQASRDGEAEEGGDSTAMQPSEK